MDSSSVLLISFCNRSEPDAPVLALLDLSTDEITIVALSRELEGALGTTGLALSDGYLFIAIQQSSIGPYLAIFDRRTLAPVDRYVFQKAADIHSLAVTDDRLIAVSSGTDEVLELRLEGHRVVSEEVRWRPDPRAPRADYHHMNGLCVHQGDPLVSGFGEKTGKLWSTAHDGFIYNLSTQQLVLAGIDHPHSIASLEDTLAYCESRCLRVRTLDGREASLPGYARGLCAIGESVYVATSRGRSISRSTGVMNNPVNAVTLAEAAALGTPQGQCSISVLSRDTFAVLRTIDLSPYGAEMYDLLPLARAAPSLGAVIPTGRGTERMQRAQTRFIGVAHPGTPSAISGTGPAEHSPAGSGPMEWAQTHIAHLTRELSLKDLGLQDAQRYVDDLHTHIDEVQTYMEGLNAYVDMLHDHVAGLETVLRGCETHWDGVQRSKGWRVVLVLRRARQVVLRLIGCGR